MGIVGWRPPCQGHCLGPSALGSKIVFFPIQVLWLFQSYMTEYLSFDEHIFKEQQQWNLLLCSEVSKILKRSIMKSEQNILPIFSAFIERCHFSIFDTTSKTKCSIYSHSTMESIFMYMCMVRTISTYTFTQRNLDGDLTVILKSLFSLSFQFSVLMDIPFQISKCI